MIGMLPRQAKVKLWVSLATDSQSSLKSGLLETASDVFGGIFRKLRVGYDEEGDNSLMRIFHPQEQSERLPLNAFTIHMPAQMFTHISTENCHSNAVSIN